MSHRKRPLTVQIETETIKNFPNKVEKMEEEFNKYVNSFVIGVFKTDSFYSKPLNWKTQHRYIGQRMSAFAIQKQRKVGTKVKLFLKRSEIISILFAKNYA